MALHVKTPSGERTLPPSADLLLTDLARRHGLSLNTRCGGRGVCNGCLVYLEQGEFEIAGETVRLTGGNRRKTLGCQTRVLSENASLFIPGPSLIETSARIEDDFLLPEFERTPRVSRVYTRVPEPALEDGKWDRLMLEETLEAEAGIENVEFTLSSYRAMALALDRGNREITAILSERNGHPFLVDVRPGKDGSRAAAVAVDIGTTTVVAALIDMDSGEILRKAARYNGQIECADDVGSRMSYCRSQENVKQLQDLVIEQTLNPLIEELCRIENIPEQNIFRLAISGNTVMTHLFLGVSPVGIGRVPFHPAELVFPDALAGELGLSGHPNAVVETVPSVAGYIGGDITSDLYVSRPLETGEVTMLADVGTNGEIVLQYGDQVLACATAAGPAFEGHGIQSGCRAASGAIEGVRFGPDLDFQLEVIGENAQPVGLCGTGIIDFISEGLRTGLLNRIGRMDTDKLRKLGRYQQLEYGEHKVHACVLVHEHETATGYPILVTEADIAQILKAKGAIYGGMKTLLDREGLTFQSVDRFILAGGFGRHIRLDTAIAIGLLPEIPFERYDVVGNGSLAGACMALLCQSATKNLRLLSHKPRVVELNLTDEFESNFVEAMMLPNMDDELFPEVIGKLPPEVRG